MNNDRTCGDCLYWHNTEDPDESCDSSPRNDAGDDASESSCFMVKDEVEVDR